MKMRIPSGVICSGTSQTKAAVVVTLLKSLENCSRYPETCIPNQNRAIMPGTVPLMDGNVVRVALKQESHSLLFDEQVILTRKQTNGVEDVKDNEIIFYVTSTTYKLEANTAMRMGDCEFVFNALSAP